jgi:hypothetical protein
MKKYILAIVFGLTIVPSLSFAQTTATNPGNTGGGSVTNPTVVAKLENPLGGDVDSLGALFKKLFDIIVGISYAVVAFFLILSGFRFVVAQGNPGELEKAKTTFWYTIVGALLVIGAQTIATILQNLVTEVGK